MILLGKYLFYCYDFCVMSGYKFDLLKRYIYSIVRYGRLEMN